MELFKVLTNLLVVLGVLLGLAVGIWFVMGLYWVHSRKDERELPEVDLPADIHEVFTGVPPVLVIFYVFIFVSSMGYVAYIWLRGISY